MNTLLIDITDRIARVTLNRPDVHNALNEEMIAELTQAFEDLSKDSAVRVIVLTGAGKSFSAGADLNWMQRAALQSEAENRADALGLAEMLNTINTCPKPVIGLINGAALGGGVGLVSCCDIVIAHTNAMFGLTEVRIGLIPATISPYVLAKIVETQARRYMLTSERFSADTARTIGLAHEVSDDPNAAVQPIIEALLANGPDAMSDTKRLIADIQTPMSEALRAMTADRIAARRASSEGREGIAAFLEKRKPGWTI